MNSTSRPRNIAVGSTIDLTFALERALGHLHGLVVLAAGLDGEGLLLGERHPVGPLRDDRLVLAAQVLVDQREAQVAGVDRAR